MLRRILLTALTIDVIASVSIADRKPAVGAPMTAPTTSSIVIVLPDHSPFTGIVSNAHSRERKCAYACASAPGQ